MSENVLHLGLCLPKSCSNRQIQLLVEKLLNQKKQQNAFGMKTKVVEVKDLKFNPRFLLRKSFLALIAYFVFAKIVRRIASKQKDRRKLDDNNNAVSCTEHVKPLTFLEKFTKCFDYDENKKSIRDRTPQALGINSISGLRWSDLWFLVVLVNIVGSSSGQSRATWSWFLISSPFPTLCCWTKFPFSSVAKRYRATSWLTRHSLSMGEIS